MELDALLSNMMKSCFILLSAASYVNDPFFQCIHIVYSVCLLVTQQQSQSSGQLQQYLSANFQVTLIFFKSNPRSAKVLLLMAILLVYNCCVLLLVTVNLCLIYKLNFLISMYIQDVVLFRFQASSGSLGTYPQQMGAWVVTSVLCTTFMDPSVNYRLRAFVVKGIEVDD